MHNLYTSRARKRRNAKQAMPEHYYGEYKTTQTVAVSIPSQLVDRLFSEGASLTINLRVAPDSIPVYLHRPLSRASSSWSTVGPTEKGGLPSYQEMVECRIESRLVGPEVLLLEDVPYDPPYEPEQRGLNIFTDNNPRGNSPQGRGFGANVACVSPNTPRGRGLNRLKNNRSPFLGRGRPSVT